MAEKFEASFLHMSTLMTICPKFLFQHFPPLLHLSLFIGANIISAHVKTEQRKTRASGNTFNHYSGLKHNFGVIKIFSSLPFQNISCLNTVIV
jgi:hypothetical protein